MSTRRLVLAAILAVSSPAFAQAQPASVKDAELALMAEHGTVFDPACGSGGMFVQSSHFIEHKGGDTAKKVVFYGQEKNPDTIHIAKMNLAVNGLRGTEGFQYSIEPLPRPPQQLA